jgi:hypothetical protein
MRVGKLRGPSTPEGAGVRPAYGWIVLSPPGGPSICQSLIAPSGATVCADLVPLEFACRTPLVPSMYGCLAGSRADDVRQGRS